MQIFMSMSFCTESRCMSLPIVTRSLSADADMHAWLVYMHIAGWSRKHKPVSVQ
jgi:hypothetical protein